MADAQVQTEGVRGEGNLPSPFAARHRTGVMLAAGVAPLVACLVLSVFRDDVSSATAVLVLVLVVVASASSGLRAAGFAAAVSSGVFFDFFLTEPYGRLAINDPNDIEATVLLVLIGAAVTEVALWGYRQQAQAGRRAGYLDGVLGTVNLVAASNESPEVLIQHICDQIELVLRVEKCEFVPGRVLDPRVAVLGQQGLVVRGGHVVNVDRDGLPTNEYTALRVTRGNALVGHFMLSSAASIARPSLEQRKVAVLLADQAGSLMAKPIV